MTVGEKLFVSFGHFFVRLLPVLEDFARADVGLVITAVLLLEALDTYLAYGRAVRHEINLVLDNELFGDVIKVVFAHALEAVAYVLFN